MSESSAKVRSMKKFLILTIALSALFTQNSHADWQNLIECNSGGLVVDTRIEDSQHQYQLVLRDPGAVARFVAVTHLGPSINERGELIVFIAPTRAKELGTKSFFTTLPISSSRNGYIVNMSADLDQYSSLTLDIIGDGPTGPEKVNVWKFYQCRQN
jgi:hypothetical protein